MIALGVKEVARGQCQGGEVLIQVEGASALGQRGGTEAVRWTVLGYPAGRRKVAVGLEATLRRLKLLPSCATAGARLLRNFVGGARDCLHGVTH